MSSSENYEDLHIIEAFLNKYTNIKSQVRYKTTVYDFIHLVTYKKIREITKEEILGYFDLIKDNASRVSHFKEFIKYSINGLLSDDIISDGNFIENIYNFRPLEKESGKTAIDYPISTIIQIDKDIKTNYKRPSVENKWDYERTIKIAFLWELLFDAGVTVTDIKAFKARYIIDRNEYIESGIKNSIVENYYSKEPNLTKTIINDYYFTLLLNLAKKKNKDGFNSIQSLETYYNNELQVYKLLAQDIQHARSKFYITCPNCKTQYKTTSSNWVFIRHKDSSEKYLTCKQCKGEGINDE